MAIESSYWQRRSTQLTARSCTLTGSTLTRSPSRSQRSTKGSIIHAPLLAAAAALGGADPSAATATATSLTRLPACSFQAAAQYIEEHNLQKAVEDAINATIKAKPEEPFAFMVGFHRRQRQPGSTHGG